MEDLYFETYDDLVYMGSDLFDEMFNEIDFPWVTFVAADYYEAKQIAQVLFRFDYEMDAAEIVPPYVGGYEGEYYIHLTTDGVSITRAKDDNGEYIDMDADAIFVSECACCFVLRHLESPVIDIFSVDEDAEDFEDGY